MSNIRDLFANQLNQDQPIRSIRSRKKKDLIGTPIEDGDILLYALVYRRDNTAKVETITEKSLDNLAALYDYGDTYAGSSLVRLCEKGMTI